MKDTHPQLAAMKARAEAATGAPWSSKNWMVAAFVEPGGPPIEVICYTATNNKSRTEKRQADAEFIAHARTDLPKVVACLEAVIGPLERCRDMLIKLRDSHDLASITIQNQIDEIDAALDIINRELGKE